MKFTKHRKAFSMLTALFVIVIMASVGAMVMSLSGKMVKTTTTQFQREQAMLLAKSYTEYAIMAVMANNRVITCLDTITGNNILNTYNINVNIAYIGNTGVDTCANVLSNGVKTPQSSLNILIDVYVRYPNFDNPTDQNTTYHKRTLQKI